MNNRNLASAFAKGADKGQGSHMFIERGVIYSYGHHFPIAIRVGGRVLVNADKYSPSTSRHQSYVRSALSVDGALVSAVNTDTIKKFVSGIKGYYETDI